LFCKSTVVRKTEREIKTETETEIETERHRDREGGGEFRTQESEIRITDKEIDVER
jgi:hypothetical protein